MTVYRDTDRAEVRAAAVALARAVGLDASGLADRLERVDPRVALAEVLGAGRSLLPEDPDPRIARAREEVVSWAAGGIRCLTVRDESYSSSLQMVHDRPALLWVAGDHLLAADRRAIAVVGTRHPSAAARDQATAIVTEFVRAGFAVLSGLAAGIDTTAHRAALAAGGRTVAVIGTGLRHAYPSENASLQAELIRSQAVVSAFWPEDGPAPERFRRRNAIMSGLGLGTLIVEASVRSGTRVQARLALAHGRPVFLCRRLLAQSWAAELSRRPGVHIVDSAADVLEIVQPVLGDGSPLIDDRLQSGRDEPGG